MQDFIHYNPTEIVFGHDAELQTGKEIKKWGGSKVLILFGGESSKKSGLLNRIEDVLSEEGIPFMAMGGVKPNPRLSFARSAVKAALGFHADFILAVGGGSVIDTAKATAIGACNPEYDLWDIWQGKVRIRKNFPVGSVLTIAAAGSESSDSAVLTNEEEKRKQGLGTPLNRPKFAIMNPELTMTLPKYQLACGIVDIMMHTLDRYFVHIINNQMTDQIAEAVLRVTINNGRKAFADSKDYNALSELMWCGSLSHNGITGLGAGREFAVHKLGHELSARFDTAHGATLSVLWGAWAEYVYQENPARFAKYARNVWFIEELDDERAAKQGIQKTVDYFRALDMPTCFGELKEGVQSEEVMTDLAKRATKNDTFKISTFKPLGLKEVIDIYKMSNREECMDFTCNDKYDSNRQ